MNKQIMFLLVSFLLIIQIHAQKSRYEAYLGTRINWNDDRLMECNIASYNSGKLSAIPFTQNDDVCRDEIIGRDDDYWIIWMCYDLHGNVVKFATRDKVFNEKIVLQ